MQHGPAASSGSNPKAPGSAGGYLLMNLRAISPLSSRSRFLQKRAHSDYSGLPGTWGTPKNETAPASQQGRVLIKGLAPR